MATTVTVIILSLYCTGTPSTTLSTNVSSNKSPSPTTKTTVPITTATTIPTTTTTKAVSIYHPTYQICSNHMFHIKILSRFWPHDQQIYS